MKRLVVAAVCLILAVALALAGCSKSSSKSPTNPVVGATETAAGDAELAGGDYAGANAHYKAALAADPSNPRANFGAAVTEVYLAQGDPGVDSLIAFINPSPQPLPRNGQTLEGTRFARGLGRFGLSPRMAYDPMSASIAMARIFMKANANPPAFSNVQHVISTVVLPRLLYAQDRLAVIEQHPEFVYKVAPAVSGSADTIEIDLGEIYALDAVINSVEGVFGPLIAYNFDTPYDSVKVDSLLTAGTAFGTLNTGGAITLQASRTHLLASKTKLDAMIAFINAETDDQSDDLIPKAALLEPGFTQFVDSFTQFQTSLTSQVSVNFTTYQGTQVPVALQVGNFFLTPIADWKTKLPAHTFPDPYTVVVTDPITFPDPTFNNIFPGMTNAVWQSIIGPVNPPPPVLARRAR